MAARMVCSKSAHALMVSRQRVVAYLPSLSSIVRHFRNFSSYDEQNPPNGFPEVIVTDVNDLSLGPLDPHDKRFPLPGFVGPAPAVKNAAQTTLPKRGDETSEIFTEPLPHERQHAAFATYMTVSKELDAQEQADAMAEGPGAFDILECVASDCPELLKKDFQDLFPGRNLSQGNVTVITLCQKTQNDMTGWSPQVEEEREVLLEHFIAGATEICVALHEVGFWADFIDPSSGRPYLGPYTNSTMFETDERYRNFGFQIDDLGCCKVIRHHLWGTQAYVGSLFTNAPVDHPILQNLTESKPE